MGTSFEPSILRRLEPPGLLKREAQHGKCEAVLPVGLMNEFGQGQHFFELAMIEEMEMCQIRGEEIAWEAPAQLDEQLTGCRRAILRHRVQGADELYFTGCRGVKMPFSLPQMNSCSFDPAPCVRQQMERSCISLREGVIRRFRRNFQDAFGSLTAPQNDLGELIEPGGDGDGFGGRTVVRDIRTMNRIRSPRMSGLISSRQCRYCFVHAAVISDERNFGAIILGA